MSVQSLADLTGVTIGGLERKCVLTELEPLLSTVISQMTYVPHDVMSAGGVVSSALDTLGQQGTVIDLNDIGWDGPILTHFTRGLRSELKLLIAIGLVRKDLLGRVLALRGGLRQDLSEGATVSESIMVWQTLFGRGVVSMASPNSAAPVGSHSLHSRFTEWLSTGLLGNSGSHYNEVLGFLVSARIAWSSWPEYIKSRISFQAANKAETSWLLIDSVTGIIMSYSGYVNPTNGFTIESNYTIRDWATDSAAIKQMFIDNNIAVNWKQFGLDS